MLPFALSLSDPTTPTGLLEKGAEHDQQVRTALRGHAHLERLSQPTEPLVYLLSSQRPAVHGCRGIRLAKIESKRVYTLALLACRPCPDSILDGVAT